MSNIITIDRSKMEATVSNMSKGTTGRVGFLKMSKAGQWSFGADEEPIGPDDELFIDPMGFVHGWQCWADLERVGAAELLGSVVVPSYEAMPLRPAEIPVNGRQWAELRGLSALLGDQKLVYTTTSYGGLQAVADLCKALGEQYKKSKTHLIAVVNLRSESYPHKKYGKIFNPIFDVVEWLDAVPEETAEPAPAPAPPPPPVKVARTRMSRKAA